METKAPSPATGKLSEDPAILKAELSLARRRVDAMIGELRTHLDRENQLVNELNNQRDKFRRDMQWVREQRAADKAAHQQTENIYFFFAVTGWCAFIGTVLSLLIKQ